MLTVQRTKQTPWTVESVLYKEVYNRTDGRQGNRLVDHYVPDSVWYTEVMTPNSTGSKSEWKSWEHFKSWCASQPLPSGIPVYASKWELAPSYHVGTPVNPYGVYVAYSGSGSVMYYGNPGQLDSGLPGFYVPRAEDGGFIPPPVGADGMVQRALNSMLPIIKSELSVMNSAYELKDFTTLPKTWAAIKKLGAMTDRLVTRTGELIRLQSRATLSDYARVVSDSYLQTKFNFEPLISDISGIYTALSSVEKRISDFITRQGRVQTKHYSFRFTEFTNSSEISPAYFAVEPYKANPFSTCKVSRLVDYDPSGFHCQIQYNYNYTELQVAHARLLSLLDSLGIQLNPAIIWNGIRWTFLIDWFVGVSQFLSTFKYEAMKPKINMLKFCWSIRRARRITCHISNVGSFYAYPGVVNGQQTTLPVVTQTAYRRSVKLPTASSIQTSGLNSTEFTLGAALVYTNRRHPRNKRKSR